MGCQFNISLKIWRSEPIGTTYVLLITVDVLSVRFDLVDLFAVTIWDTLIITH
jgi:hypothetical protein